MKPEYKLSHIFVSFWEATNKFDSFEFSFVKLKPINVSVKGQLIGRIMKKIGLLLVGMLVSTSVLAEGAMRCGSSIISVGDTKSEMLMKCGTPIREGANKRGNSSRLTQSFHFFMFEPTFSPVNALNKPI